MLNFFFTPLIISIFVLAIPTIAFEEDSNKINIKYELNASLDELVLNYCNSYDSYTINKLYSEKEILKIDILRTVKLTKPKIIIRNKPLNPNILTNIKTSDKNVSFTNLTEIDLNYLHNSKRQFIRIVLPLIINENQKIISERENLLLLKNKLFQKNTLNINEIKKLKNLSKIYKISFDNNYKYEIIEELLNRIDIIPNSIVLAQAAIESGWGSSRFAKEYNALFGEYTYDNNKGVVPLKRKSGDRHLIKSFNSYNSSVESYFKNINSHFAYSEFRKIRKIMRERNNFSNIKLLIQKLDTYAEDKDYIKTIDSVINKNNFKIFDTKTISF
tara:strand:+ start:911 stop:1900 length:990 start_codon:yes stop_codon:yes gene_type:complete